MRIVLAAALLAAVVAALCGAGAQGARATSCTTVPGYLGDDAAKTVIAAWMATGATAAGIPGELRVMGALVESDVRNLEQGDTDSAGFFAMRVAIRSAAYPGFPDHPDVQLRWFTDQALQARQHARRRRHPLRLRPVTATLRAGHARTLALQVPRSARRLLARALRRGGAVRARLRITVVDAAGNATIRGRVVRIV